MPQTSIFRKYDVGYEIEFHTVRKTYKTLKAVNTKTTLLLDERSMIKWHYILNNLRLFSDFLGIQVNYQSVIIQFLFRIDDL